MLASTVSDNSKDVISMIQNIASAIEGFDKTIVIAAVIALYLMQAVAYWGVFGKAGEKKWKCFVPVLNSYTRFKISWSKLAFWICLILALLRFSPYFISEFAPDFAYGDYIAIAAAAILLIMQFISCIKISRCFGRKFGYAIGLLILPQLFMLILGLGNSEYKRENK